MRSFIAYDRRGRPLVRLLAEDYAAAVLHAFRGGVPGAHNVISDGDEADTDVRVAESQLVAAFKSGGLSEAEAKIAARGRYDPTTRILRTIRVPYQSATARPSSTATRISESESPDDDRRSVELREPGSIDLASGGLTEFKERGVRDSVAEALADLYVGFRRSGMSKAEALAAARGRDYPIGPRECHSLRIPGNSRDRPRMTSCRGASAFRTTIRTTRRGSSTAMSQVDPAAEAAKGVRTELAERVRVAQDWTAYEDALLVLAIGLYDELAPAAQLGGVNEFVLKTALWSMPPEQSLSDNQILSLFDALQSLHERGLIQFRAESGGRFQAHPLEPGRRFADEDVHDEWVDIFDRRLSPERLAILGKLHQLSYQVQGAVPMLGWVDEAQFLPSLAAGDGGAQPGYEAWAEASRHLKELSDAGFIETRPDRARPTYAACVRVERRRPLAVFPDVVGRLEQALAHDARFAGALRKLRAAVDQASERPYPNAEDAIKNAASAVESAAQEITHEPGDLADQARILTRRGLFSREIARIAGDLFTWRSATPGVAHGAAAQPAVDEAEARLAIQVAAGLVAYLAQRVGPPP